MTISTSNQSVVPKDMPQGLGLETLRLKASHKLKLLILGAVGALVPVVSTKEPRRIASSLGWESPRENSSRRAPAKSRKRNAG